MKNIEFVSAASRFVSEPQRFVSEPQRLYYNSSPNGLDQASRRSATTPKRHPESRPPADEVLPLQHIISAELFMPREFATAMLVCHGLCPEMIPYIATPVDGSCHCAGACGARAEAHVHPAGMILRTSIDGHV